MKIAPQKLSKPVKTGFFYEKLQEIYAFPLKMKHFCM